MSMQTDVKAATAGSVGIMVTGRTRLKEIIFPCGSSAGVILLSDGASGQNLISLTTAAAAGQISILLPGEGILAYNGIYLTTLTTVVSVTVIYG